MSVTVSVAPRRTNATAFPPVPQRPKMSTKRSRSLPIDPQETIPKLKDSKQLFWFLPPKPTTTTRSTPDSTTTQRKKKKKPSGAFLPRNGRTEGLATAVTRSSKALLYDLDAPLLYRAAALTTRYSTLVVDEIHEDDTIHWNSSRSSSSSNFGWKNHLLCFPSLQSKEQRTKRPERPPPLGLAWDDVALESIYDNDDDDDESLVGVDFVVL